MSRPARVLQSGMCEITQGYKGSAHAAVDIVRDGYRLDNIVAHSDGTVVQVINNCNENTNGQNGNRYDSNNPGNMVKIDHGNGYYTRYLHLTYGTVNVSVGQKVSKGDVLGYMGNTGYSFGGHLHFEVWDGGSRIDPTPYLDADLPTPTPEPEKPSTGSRNVGDVVDINGVYVSSTSTERLNPAVTRGTITRIIEGARNPYLLNDGNIGWINEDCIVGSETVRYLHNPNYTGNSIVDGLNGIGVDSSFAYRARLAEVNGISNYRGTAEQNTQMLNMLKNGTLKAA